MADQIALDLVASLPRQERELFACFHPLCHHRQSKATAETNDGPNDRGRLRILVEVGDESAVDLDFVERKRLQIRQGRIAGSEVVHCDLDTEQLQSTQDSDRPREVVDQNAFGNLKLQTGGRKPCLE